MDAQLSQQTAAASPSSELKLMNKLSAEKKSQGVQHNRGSSSKRYFHIVSLLLIAQK